MPPGCHNQRELRAWFWRHFWKVGSYIQLWWYWHGEWPSESWHMEALQGIVCVDIRAETTRSCPQTSKRCCQTTSKKGSFGSIHFNVVEESGSAQVPDFEFKCLGHQVCHQVSTDHVGYPVSQVQVSVDKHPVSQAQVSVDHVGYPVSHAQVHPLDSSVLRMWVYQEESIPELGCRCCLQVCSVVRKAWYSLLTKEHQWQREQRDFIPGMLKLYAKLQVLTWVSGTLEIKGEGNIQFQVIMDDVNVKEITTGSQRWSVDCFHLSHSLKTTRETVLATTSLWLERGHHTSHFEKGWRTR